MNSVRAALVVTLARVRAELRWALPGPGRAGRGRGGAPAPPAPDQGSFGSISLV
jgi:hypothetical protein